jgi:putative transposase
MPEQIRQEKYIMRESDNYENWGRCQNIYLSMPRKARLNIAATVAHVMARSLTSETLFGDDQDRSLFLDMLAKCLNHTAYRCYGWVLMSNHFHLVTRSSDRELWELMKPLDTEYSLYHKKKYHRDGPLFRERYKSILTQDQNYIGALVRYVHLNPVRAGICKNIKELDRYPWSASVML